jgi:hypothetical protein
VNSGGELWGTQIGLFNMADRIHGLSIGLISIERGGTAAIEGTSDLEGRAQASVKIGTRSSYTIMSVGTRSLRAPADWNLALGLGLRLPLGDYFVDADAEWRAYSEDRGRVPSFALGSQSAIGRILLGIRIGGPVALVGGLSSELHIPGLTLEADGSLCDSYSWDPGLIIGVQL